MKKRSLAGNSCCRDYNRVIETNFTSDTNQTALKFVYDFLNQLAWVEFTWEGFWEVLITIEQRKIIQMTWKLC